MRILVWLANLSALLMHNLDCGETSIIWSGQKDFREAIDRKIAQENLLLLATVYIRADQAYRSYRMLKGKHIFQCWYQRQVLVHA